MDKENFKKRFKGIKMWKYVPLLIKQCKIYKNSRDDWTDTALEMKDNWEEEHKLVKLFSYLLILVSLWGVVNFIALILRLGGIL